MAVNVFRCRELESSCKTTSITNIKKCIKDNIFLGKLEINVTRCCPKVDGRRILEIHKKHG